MIHNQLTEADILQSLQSITVIVLCFTPRVALFSLAFCWQDIHRDLHLDDDLLIRV